MVPPVTPADEIHVEAGRGAWPRAVAVARACDPGDVAHPDAFARAAARDPHHTVLVAGDGDAAVAAELGRIDSWNEPTGRWMTLWIPAGLHDSPQAAALWGAVVAHSAAHGVDRVRGAVPADRHAELAFLGARGFGEVERSQRVALRLAAEPAPAEAPPGVALVTLAERPGLFDQILEIDGDAIPDIPGDAADVPDRPFWRDSLADGTYRATTTVFAVDHAGRALAYAVLRHHAGRDDVADHEFTGTRRDARGRGMAAAVKRAQARAAWRDGVRTLRAWNHLDNAPMRAVNAALGYARASDVVSLLLPRPPR